MTKVGSLLLVAAALLAPSARAVDANGERTERFEQFRVIVTVRATGVPGSGANASQLISGTNVVVSCSAEGAGKDGGPNPPHDAINLVRARLKVGGETLVTMPPPPSSTTGGGATGTTGGGPGATTGGDPGSGPGSGPGGDTEALTGGDTLWCGPASPGPSFRAPQGSGPSQPEFPVAYPLQIDLPALKFASTHFNDGQAVPVVLETDWDLIKNGVATGSRTVTATLNCTAYNKVLSWKTTKTASGGDWNARITGIIQGVISAGRSAYGAANYGYVPTPSGPDLLTAAQVVAGDFNGKATSLFGMTHGYSSRVEDSFHSTPLLAFLGRWDGVAHPLGYAINVFYACETMGTSDADKMPYQHGSPPPGQWIDSGRVGFRVTVFPDMRNSDRTPTNHTLDEHAREFFNSLANGYTLDEARKRANRLVFNRGEDSGTYSVSAYMLIAPTIYDVYSDRLATFRYVYLASNERTDPTTPDTRWYKVLP